MRTPRLFATAMLALASLLFTGCATIAEQTVQKKECTNKWDPADFSQYERKGTAKIYGQAFLMTRGGDVKLAAGQTVTALPATAFVKEVRTLRDQGILPISVTDPVAAVMSKATREAIVDAQGNYEFLNLPEGEYLLEVKIEWLAGGYKTGGLVHKIVSIRNGESQKVILTE